MVPTDTKAKNKGGLGRAADNIKRLAFTHKVRLFKNWKGCKDKSMKRKGFKVGLMKNDYRCLFLHVGQQT